MALHRLSAITFAVPDVAAVTSYYSEFGLTDNADGSLSTIDGGRQLFLEQGPRRRLVEVEVGADSPDDLQGIASRLTAMGVESTIEGDCLVATEPITRTRARVTVQSRVVQPELTPVEYNGPGHIVRTGQRAPGIEREGRVRPRKLGHVVLGTPDAESVLPFFTQGIGFKVSDGIKGAGQFIRCSEDHHNMLILNAPTIFPHHSSWQVDDVDEIGRGARDMLEADPSRHIWGLGRHHAGSNFFWYLKDPAGTFSEYYSDMDTIVDDALWKPQDFEGARGLFNWGPPPPPSFLHPDDLAELMTGSHS